MMRLVARYLWHVTLNTGDIRRSPRAEVDDRVLAAVRPKLDACLAGDDRALLPPPYRLKATAGGGGFLLVTMMMIDDGTPLVTAGIAPRSRGAGRLWSMLHDAPSAPLKTLAHEPPQPPWCGARIEAPGIALRLPEWVGDMERVVAWAWIERSRRDDPIAAPN